jgi:hypothetical protein
LGLRSDTLRSNNPRIARAFDTYLACRNVQLFHMKIESKTKVENKITEFVTGYSQLPEAGGVLDQPAWLMAMFDQFRAGENAAAAKTLK